MVYIENISKTYKTKLFYIKALDDVSLTVDKGKFIVIRGPSGSGKTTLLLAIGGMLKPTNGKIIIDNKDIYAMNKSERAIFRAKNIGFIFQMFHLLPYLNLYENIMLPTKIINRAQKTDAIDLISRLGLAGREHHKPSELSAGEKQRTAIARALINRPDIILADEPTGNLDNENANEVIEYLAEFHRNGGTVIIATHDSLAEKYSDSIIHLQHGKIAY